MLTEAEKMKKTLQKRTLELRREGFDAKEIAELLNSEGFKRADGSALTWRNAATTLAHGARDKNARKAAKAKKRGPYRKRRPAEPGATKPPKASSLVSQVIAADIGIEDKLKLLALLLEAKAK